MVLLHWLTNLVIGYQLVAVMGWVFIKWVVYIGGLLCEDREKRILVKNFLAFLAAKNTLGLRRLLVEKLLLSSKLIMVLYNLLVRMDLHIEYGYFLQLGFLASKDQSFVALSPQQDQLNSHCLGLAFCQQTTGSGHIGYH